MDEENIHKKRIRVKITNTEISNVFIKIKAQHVNSEEFKALIELKSIFKNSNDITNADIKLGDQLYIARLDLDNYARCRLVEVDDFSYVANIDLIDSCRKIKISYSQLKILPKTSKLYKIPSIAKEYVIAELIVSRESDDYRQKFNKFYELIVNKNLEIEILEKNKAGEYVQIYSMEASIVHDIIPNHPSLHLILKRIQLSEQMNLMLEQLNQSCQASSTRQETSLIPRNEFNFYLSYMEFSTDERHEVRISSYLKGPNLFYVQLIKDLKQYQAFHIDIQKINLYNLKIRPRVSEICLASLESNNVQRVEIIESNVNLFKVRSIDHGNEKVVKFNELYAIPESIRLKKPFAWKFSLHGTDKFKNLSSLELSFYFQFITDNKKLTLITKPGSAVDDTAKCSLFDGTNDILNILNAWDPRNLSYPQQIPLSNFCKVKVVYAESPKLFFVNDCDTMASYSSIFKQFSQFNSCNYMITTANSACYVQIGNRNWRGSFEKRISSSICQIKLVDIGVIEDFSCKEVKVMIEKYTRIPPMAYKCCLVGYKNLNFDKDDLKVFVMKCKQHQTFNMNIIDYDGDTYYVTLETDLESYINEELSLRICESFTITSQRGEMDYNGNYIQSTSESQESIPKAIKSTPTPEIYDWTYDERKEFGEQNLWEESSTDRSFNDYNCNGIITSVISPNDFTIQCVDTMPQVNKILSELQELAPTEMPLTEFANGTFCVAMNPYSQKWCRTIILDADIDENNTLVTVRDVDDGQIFSIPNLNELKASFVFMAKPYYGIRCRLPIKINIKVEDEAHRVFMEMCYYKEVPYKIIAVNEFINVCDILVDDKSITDRFVELNLAVKATYIPNGTVYVAYIKNLQEFYVHLEKEIQLLKNIVCYTEGYLQIPLKSPVEGITVMAKSKKYNKWYRSKIKSIDGEDILVKFIDYGDTEVVKITDLGLMDEYCLLKQSPLAHRCSLNLPNDLNPDSPKAIEEFRKIVDNGNKLSLRMIEPKLKISVVMIYLDDETNILSILINLCEKIENRESSLFFDSKICNSTASSDIS